MNDIIAGVLGVIISILGVVGYQVANAPTFGNGPGTINQLQLWKSSGNRIELASSTAGVRVTSLANLPCIGTDSEGDLGSGTCTGGGGGSGSNWTVFNGNGWLAPSTTIGVIVNASSTFNQKLNLNSASSTLFTATTGWFTNLNIGADTLAEYISDTAGAQWTGNTETGIAITYQDADNTIDAVVDDVTPAMLQAADFGSFTCNGTTCTIDAQAVASSMLANADFGNFTVSGGTATIDNASVTNAMLANSTISGISLGSNLANLSATDSTLTFSGTYTGATARTIGLNLSNPNTWSALQIFGNASSTLFSTAYASSTLYFGAGLSNCNTGNMLTWASGQYGCEADDNTTYTAGDALTLTGTEIDFDGGATPAGDLGGTWASPSVTDDSHAHTSTTISGLDVSADTNLTAGDGITLTDDDLDCDTASASVFGCLSAANWTTFNNKWDLASSTIPITKGGTGLTAVGASSTVLTTNGTIMIWQSIVTYVESIISAASLVLTGNWDFGGATGLEIPNGTAPTVNATGELAWDTTSGQQVIYDGSATRVLSNGYQYASFSYSTTTAWTGTTTIPLGPAGVGETWSQGQCFTNTGTLQVSFNDGTNRMNFMNASTTVGIIFLSTNNTFTLSEKRYVDVGTPASSPTKISCTVRKALTAD